MQLRGEAYSRLAAALEQIEQQKATIEALREENRQLRRAILQGNDALWRTFRLPPMLTRLLGMLRSEDFVSAEMIQAELGYSTDPKIAILRLRRELARWDIVIQSARARGYFLTDDMKERVHALVSSGVGNFGQDKLVRSFRKRV